MNERNAIYMLEQVKGLLDSINISFWLDSGTLLAAIRDKKFIPWDNDIDLGVWHSDIDKIFSQKKFFQEVNKRGLQFYLLEDKLIFERKNIPVNISIFKKSGDSAVRYLLTIKGSKGKIFKILWWILSMKKFNKILIQNIFNLITFGKHVLLCFSRIIPVKLKSRWIKKLSKPKKNSSYQYMTWSVPYKYFKSFSKIKFYGTEYLVPKDIEDYMVFRYGSDWNVVRKDWVTLDDDGAAEK